MIVFCSLSCNACELRDPHVRCRRDRLDMDQNPAYQPGDMSKMFSDIVPRFHSKYNVSVVKSDPFVVVFENFVSDAEADAIIRAAPKWERSTDTGSANSYGEVGRVLSKSRTSSNAWCTRGCEADPAVKRVTERIAEVTRVPSVNYESFQILRYEPGQFYGVHHDNGGGREELKPAGPRVLTFFLYLSDVEEGGETNFPQLEVSVKPKKGRAVLWPSTLTNAPDEIDRRTTHEARPVVKGIKYGANAWIHLYNYRVPNLWGCTGTFG
jgi:prolyl 4-hydroxylase